MLDLILQGGIFMIPIGLCSIISIAFTIERFLYLYQKHTPTSDYWDRIIEPLEKQEWDTVRKRSEETKGLLPLVVLEGLEDEPVKSSHARDAMENYGSKVIPDLERFLPTLDFIARVSPLLGLLGTVAGMIRTFSVIAEGGIGNPDLLAGGISQALVTTAAGLTVGIITLFFHHLLSRQVDSIINDLNNCVRRIDSHLTEAEEESGS